jgi:hypothetical protein
MREEQIKILEALRDTTGDQVQIDALTDAISFIRDVWEFLEAVETVQTKYPQIRRYKQGWRTQGSGKYFIPGQGKCLDCGCICFQEGLAEGIARWQRACDDAEDEILRQNGIDPAGLVDDLQDRMQRRVAFDEDLSDEGRENLRWAINDIERHRDQLEGEGK